jgi:hypothetical protein
MVPRSRYSNRPPVGCRVLDAIPRPRLSQRLKASRKIGRLANDRLFLGRPGPDQVADYDEPGCNSDPLQRVTSPDGLPRSSVEWRGGPPVNQLLAGFRRGADRFRRPLGSPLTHFRQAVRRRKIRYVESKIILQPHADMRIAMFDPGQSDTARVWSEAGSP